MKESLLHLYELQKVDSQLDELLESRGELPAHVEEMRATLEDRRQNLEAIRTDISELSSRANRISQESLELRDKVERYKSQQFDVKTTREYDAITFQLEDGQKHLASNLESVSRMGLEVESLKADEEQFSADVVQLEEELRAAEDSLEIVLTETEAEEQALRAKHDELEPQIDEYYMKMYNRVRPAKDGIAVVPITDGVCGGCFNAVPRQIVLELRKGNDHSVCEYCGRIIVGEPIVLAVDGEPEPVHTESESEG